MDEDKDWPWHCANCGEPLKAGDRVMNRADGHINEDGGVSSMSDLLLYHTVCPDDEPPRLFIVDVDEHSALVVWSKGKAWEVYNSSVMMDLGTQQIAEVMGNALGTKPVVLDANHLADGDWNWGELEARVVKNHIENDTFEARTKRFHRTHCAEGRGDCPMLDVTLLIDGELQPLWEKRCGVNDEPDGHEMGGCHIEDYLRGTSSHHDGEDFAGLVTDETRPIAQRIVDEKEELRKLRYPAYY